MSDKIIKKPTIICLTRIKNEAWFVETFLRATEIWADLIILADQNSTDNTRSIASKHKKVRVISVSDKEFNEHKTNSLLINTARKIHGPKILFGIDTDEIFTANLFERKNWRKIISAPKGTQIKFSWACIAPGGKHYWLDRPAVRAYVDDGAKFSGLKFHSNRLPVNDRVKPIFIRNVKQFHFQYIDWDRMESKHRWYQVFERIQHPQKSYIDIYRNYHHMYSVPKKKLELIPQYWYRGYQKLGINIFTFQKDKTYWWDKDILIKIHKFGRKFFSNIDIWYINWEKIAANNGYTGTAIFKDPRRLWQKIIHLWLRFSQPFVGNRIVLKIDNLLKRINYSVSGITNV